MSVISKKNIHYLSKCHFLHSRLIGQGGLGDYKELWLLFSRKKIIHLADLNSKLLESKREKKAFKHIYMVLCPAQATNHHTCTDG